MKRRWFVYSGLGVGSSLLAGCTGDDTDDLQRTDSDSNGGTGGDETVAEASGTFRLLISDQPTAIDDFESLDVSFESARVFRGDGEGVEQDDDVIDDDVENSSAANNDDAEDADIEADNDDPVNTTETNDAGQSEGYVEFDLDGETVDLTEVIGDKAIEVLDEQLEEGKYSTIELRATDVVGIVDGAEVDVRIPSDRLRIVRPFEVVADEELSFVFDINVVRRGQQQRYNLLPVIGQSGVVGRDVEVDEIDPDSENETEADDN